MTTHPLPAAFPSHPHATEEARRIALHGTILRAEVGSGVHGIAVSGTDDRDEMGICLEPPDYVTGLGRFEQFHRHTAWDRPGGLANRSGHGDLDVVIYGARKFCKLAAAGNPSVLVLLFAPPSAIVAREASGAILMDNAHRFVSQRAGDRFLGYLRRQRKGMTGEAGTKVNRPELIAAHGYDCYLDDTEFLTHQGWMTYDQIGPEHALATVHPVTGEVEFQRWTDRVQKSYSGPVLHGSGRFTDWAVTPNHRMFVSKVERGRRGVDGTAYRPERASWGFRRADSITSRHWHMRVAGAPRSREYRVKDADLALIGAYVSEGCVGKRLVNGDPSVLRFEQKDGGRLHDTMALVGAGHPLRTYRYPEKRPVTTWTLAGRSTAKAVADMCGEGSHHKRLPAWTLNLSARQSGVLLDALTAGDGTPYRVDSGGWIYYTASPRLAGDVQALAVVAGRRAAVWGPFPSGMYQVLIKAAGEEVLPMAGSAVTTEHVEGRRTVCFTVSNETLVTRRNGKVAMHGNTKYAAHAIRLGVQGVELLTSGRITLPLPPRWRLVLAAVRGGDMSLADAVGVVDCLEREVVDLMRNPVAPPEPDYAWINSWLRKSYYTHWSHP